MALKGRPKGVFNCPFKAGFSVCYCSLDGRRCRTSFKGVSFWCRGWKPDGKPSELQKSYVRQTSLFQ